MALTSNPSGAFEASYSKKFATHVKPVRNKVKRVSRNKYVRTAWKHRRHLIKNPAIRRKVAEIAASSAALAGMAALAATPAGYAALAGVLGEEAATMVAGEAALIDDTIGTRAAGSGTRYFAPKPGSVFRFFQRRLAPVRGTRVYGGGARMARLGKTLGRSTRFKALIGKNF